MIKEWIQKFNPADLQQAESALREVMQEVALAGLQRAGFFLPVAKNEQLALNFQKYFI